MKSLWLTCCSLAAMVASSGAQSSQDHWDSLFHPWALQARQQHRYDGWLNSWKNRECSPDDVKQFWRMSLIQPVRDSLSANYYPTLKSNAALEEALQSTLYDFEAQDIADEINITRLNQNGKVAEASALEQLRLERRRIHEQQMFQAEMRERQQRMERELVALRDEVANLAIAAAQAAQAAAAAAAQSHDVYAR